jgi:NitT/TauT family transport system substrate-binding protein
MLQKTEDAHMKKYFGLALGIAGGVALAALWSPHPAAAETIKIAHSTWVGYGPLYIAREKGFFKNHGVDVELIVIEEPKERFPAMLAGRIDMIASTVDTAILYLKKPDDFQYVVAIDDSNGGDGIIAKKDITSIADLKGKNVAFSEGSVSEFYLNVLLAKAGLKESDLKPVNMAAPEAGAAFVANKVDAAVTWEPWLSKGKATDFGHLLVDSSTTPGLITDVIITTKDFATKHAKETKGIVDAWNDAVAFARANPREGNEIMAKGVGGWLKDPKIFAETLEGIKFYGGDDNKKFFGTKDKPGLLTDTVKQAIDIWSSHGKIQVKVTPEDLINYSFVNG